MNIDKKTAQHICNVIRRQIQSSYHNLHIHFSVHNEDNRKTTFLREIKQIEEHPAGTYLTKHHNKDEIEKILEKNKSRFVSIARYNKPGFLGFAKHDEYIALCFINHERFSSEDNLRNHAFQIAWHAIALYKDFIDRKKTNQSMPSFIDDHNVLTPKLDETTLPHRNLMGDIFSACIQTLQGRENSIESINNQRIIDTLSPQKGFYAENYPFPICTDALKTILKKQLSQLKKNKKPARAATKITNEIGKTYDHSIIEQWKSFAHPAQLMAWTDHTVETILGAALYTSENTYTQSTADLVAEKMAIKPETITTFQDYNPFTKQETNEHLHTMQCKRLITTALEKVKNQRDHKHLLDIAWKQNEQLRKNKAIGWCAGALLRASEIIKHCNDHTLLTNITKQAEEIFMAEVQNIPWDTLSTFSNLIFEQRRKGIILSNHDIIELSAENEEFSSIHHALYTLKIATEEDVPDELPDIHLEKQEVDIFKFVKPESEH